MTKEFIESCPRCNNKLTITQMECKECNLVLSGDFELSKFNNLSAKDLDFVMTFLTYEGNFNTIQEEKGMSSLETRRHLAEILVLLGLDKSQENTKGNMQKSKIEEIDSQVIRKIKDALNACGGRTSISLFRGDTCEIWFDPNGRGLVSPKIPPANQLTWEAFEAAVEVVMNNGGKAKKGNAQSGAKLGSEKLPMDSVEGYIAHKVHGVQEGQTAFGPGFVICAILDWAGICKNERGYLVINPLFLAELNN